MGEEEVGRSGRDGGHLFVQGLCVMDLRGGLEDLGRLHGGPLRRGRLCARMVNIGLALLVVFLGEGRIGVVRGWVGGMLVPCPTGICRLHSRLGDLGGLRNLGGLRSLGDEGGLGEGTVGEVLLLLLVSRDLSEGGGDTEADRDRALGKICVWGIECGCREGGGRGCGCGG